ncbi:MAG TPA: TIGR03790 family protein [Fimbriimonadaceae bacterium]|nr:TIGR03790 family protein [Fimbriimonadaceae bacterium]
MALRGRWRIVNRFDRALIAMVLLAGIGLSAVYLHSLRPVALPKYDSAAATAMAFQEIPVEVPASSPGRRVLVIMNVNSPESMNIGKYYAKKRGVPRANLLLLRTTTEEVIDRDTYRRDIEAPAEAAIKASKNPLDFMLFTKGMPIMLEDHGTSVDGELATNDIISKQTAHETGVGTMWFIDNPYFGKNEEFTRAKFGYSLACRLDGYTEADAMALVDRATVANPGKGPYLLDGSTVTKPGYGELNVDLGNAARQLHAKGFNVKFDPGPDFIALDEPVAGYCSWGSNDPHFDPGTYHKLKFKPGAIAETFVSTSARTFRPTRGGQSLITDLIQQGVTGIKGYVSEPYTFALARPSILFDRYTSGFNLAESFYMASTAIHWKEIVIGDPLCAPYHR